VGKFSDYRTCIKTNGVIATIALLATTEQLPLQLKCMEFADLTKSKSTVAFRCVVDLLIYRYYIENVAYVTYRYIRALASVIRNGRRINTLTN